MAETYSFQAEIKQLLHILVHSLYKDRDIFLRELISNASDALNKIQFEMLTNPDVKDPDIELGIEIFTDPENKVIRIVDTGIGMTPDDMVNNLGVIAHSGAVEFLERLRESGDEGTTSDLIGQFGVGFYSVFMVAERVEVTSRSYLLDEPAHTWISSGEDSYEIIPAEKDSRGTEIAIYLRDDAQEFVNGWKLRQIIKQHSDYVAFPIYVTEPPGEEDEDEEPQRNPVNQQTAIWRRPSGEIEEQEYNDFYRMLTMHFDEPVFRVHTQGDAPIQYYALLYIPRSSERNMLSTRKEPGLKLYARKVLIQEYTTDLLPEYLQFVQGVVDSEDVPLNVSRETVQSNPQIAKLKQALTRRILTDLGRLAKNEPETYANFWSEYSQYIKHGVISEFSDRERLLPLLRFYSSTSEDELVSLEDYVERMENVEGQEAIYYVVADSKRQAATSPHLEPFRSRGIEVIYMTETADSFMITALREYQGHQLISADAADLDLEGIGQTPDVDETDVVEQDALDQLIVYMRNVLGEQVKEIRVSKVLSSGSPARLVAPEGSIDRHMQRVYQMMEKNIEVTPKILEINAHHAIVHNLAARLERGLTDQFLDDSVTMLYENALLADGTHPDPAQLAARIQILMETATKVD